MKEGPLFPLRWGQIIEYLHKPLNKSLNYWNYSSFLI